MKVDGEGEKTEKEIKEKDGINGHLLYLFCRYCTEVPGGIRWNEWCQSLSCPVQLLLL